MVFNASTVVITLQVKCLGVLGFTNIDDQGKRAELVFNDALEGEAGKKYVMRDGKRRVVNNIEQISPSRPGEDLELSFDALQTFAYRSLKKIRARHKAKSASR